MNAATIRIEARDLPLVQDLHAAVHALLLGRLLHEESAKHWSYLVAAHDALCDAANGEM